MGEFRDLPVERTIDLRLSKRVVEVIITADHMGDRHIVVVDHDGEIVSRAAVGPQNDQIVEFAIRDRDIALYVISDRCRALLWCLQPYDRRYPGRRFCGIAVAPRPVIAHRPPLSAGLLAHCLQFSRRAIAIVGATRSEELLHDLGVPRGASRLINDLAIPAKPEPIEPLDDCGYCVGGRPRPVGVLDTQPKDAAVMPRKEPIEQRGPSAADMQKACGRGGKTDDDGHSRRMGKARGDINGRAICGRETSRASGFSLACRWPYEAVPARSPRRPGASNAGTGEPEARSDHYDREGGQVWALQSAAAFHPSADGARRSPRLRRHRHALARHSLGRSS